jgi:hypothetical protein
MAKMLARNENLTSRLQVGGRKRKEDGVEGTPVKGQGLVQGSSAAATDKLRWLVGFLAAHQAPICQRERANHLASFSKPPPFVLLLSWSSEVVPWGTKTKGYDLTLYEHENREDVLSSQRARATRHARSSCGVQSSHSHIQNQDGAFSPNPPDLVCVFLVRGETPSRGLCLGREAPWAFPTAFLTVRKIQCPNVAVHRPVCCALSAPLIKVARQPNLISSHLTWTDSTPTPPQFKSRIATLPVLVPWHPSLAPPPTWRVALPAGDLPS